MDRADRDMASTEMLIGRDVAGTESLIGRILVEIWVIVRCFIILGTSWSGSLACYSMEQ